LLQGSSGNNVGDVARGDWKQRDPGEFTAGECRKNSTLGNCSGEFIAVGVAPGKKDISGTEKDT